ncbi:hypothetical protein GOP47_0008174 [Adiantum capillus-veneris]|uniref:Uncharacterized protein n=1 Tax=Adiantum capillus-veneris TaxID=13818 RepID=A0A9D4UY80_ADICA|nr:hypothetical protein GOP47_0008174 [Adiantum capillus-veneris]
MMPLHLCAPPPASKRGPRCCCDVHHHHLHAAARATKDSSWAPVLKVAPLCLALLLCKECAAPALADNRFPPHSPATAAPGLLFKSRVDEAISLLEKGRQAQSEEDFRQALLWYTQVIKEHGDLALAEYARVGRAICLYEVGDKEEAFVEMEDVSVSLKGYPEVHAALAAVLYADKNSPLSAEQQFTIATLLDPHYTDLSYVKDTKHWPPSLVRSLAKFIDLQ